jgi:hypothetical protein
MSFGMLHLNKWFRTKEQADAFCTKKNKTSRIYKYKPQRSNSGDYFIIGYKK